MVNGRPAELIFVEGPQRGQRVALVTAAAIAGRGNQAEIPLLEETVSRQQMRFELTAQGWLVESLSKTSPLHIGKRKYKPGKRVLLATGDVLAVGVETHILFVDSGDSAAEAVAAYEADNPAPEPIPVPAPTPAPPPTPPTGPDLEAQPTTYIDVPAEREEEITPDELAERERKAKIRKYAVGFGIYLVVMVIGIVVLATMKQGGGGRGRIGPPARLSTDDIQKALSSPITREPNEVASLKHLEEARRLFDERTKQQANLYRCHKNYRLYKAYRRRDQQFFSDPADSRKSSVVERELTDRIAEIYNSAMLYEKGRAWLMATKELDLLWAYLPPDDIRDDPEVYDALWENVLDHQRYIRSFVNQKR